MQTKISTDMIDRACSLVKTGISFSSIAAKLRIHRSTLYRWLELGGNAAQGEEDESLYPDMENYDLYEKFFFDFGEAMADLEIDLVSEMKKNGFGGKWKPFHEILKARFPKEYKEQAQAQTLIDNRTQEVKLLSDEMADKVLAIMTQENFEKLTNKEEG